MCLRSISRILEFRKNIESDLKGRLVFYFCKKDLECPELGENGAPLKTHLYFLFRNYFLTQTKL